MDKRKTTSFFGTPLSKSFDDNSANNDEGPINSRRARLNQQQTARDEQGRRRFHGAFTGGFSAGYYNTVDSVQGFRPKSFVSHRRDRNQSEDGRGGTKFSHKPEDYMDEEDRSEFGIAPRRVRMVGSYHTDLEPSVISRVERESCSRLVNLLRPAPESIGEKILKRMSNQSRCKNNFEVDKPVPQKNDFHGLGYKPLSISFLTRHNTSSNPLEAVLSGGKRLKITGEAFGSGVLDDEEDNVDISDEYGYDDIANYDLSSKSRFRSKNKVDRPCGRFEDDIEQTDSCQFLADFVLAQDVDAMKLCDDIRSKYPLPAIEPDWRMPVRSEPYICPQVNQDTAQQELSWKKTHQSTSLFNKKFTSSTTQLLKDDNIETRSGLVLYTDLKADESIKSKLNLPASSTGIETSQVSINRQTIEWRPCSLLCKHFNVPNPYPDNAFFGVKPPNLIKPPDDNQVSGGTTKFDEGRTQCERIAPIELRESIFNIKFDNDLWNDAYDNNKGADECETLDSEDEPQVLEDNTVQSQSLEGGTQDISDQDSDIVVVNIPRPEPEVIVLSSSSLSTSRSLSTSPSPSVPVIVSGSGAPSPNECKGGGRKGYENDSDLDDTYGPPLPPTRKTLIDVDHRRSDASRHRSSSKSHKKKRKKQKSSNRSTKKGTTAK